MAVRRSKIRPPRAAASAQLRTGLRARLLSAVGTHRLLLLRAPAGYGKSTLLADLVGSLPAETCAWVNVESGDNLGTLIDALLAALEGADLPWRTSARALLAASADDAALPGLVDAFAEALDARETEVGLIVFDDWHRCTDARAARWLDALVAALPAPWSVALGTRDEAALSRWRARGEVFELSRADLAFDAAEGLRWAQAAGWRDAAAVRALVRQTHGWGAALCLAITARAQGRAPDLMHADLAEFVATEVMADLPPELSDFLLRCSVLPELSASRCAAVSGDADAATHLANLRRRDLFVSEVDESGTLRLHDLFRQALRTRLDQQAPQLVPVLLRRASAGERDPVRRVHWLIEAGDVETAAAELEAASAALITDGAAARVEQALRGFTFECLRDRPALAIVQARLAWSRWDFETMLRVLAQVPASALQDCPPALRDCFDAYLVVALDSAHRRAERDRLIAAVEGRPLAPLPRLLLSVTQLGTPADEADVTRMASRLRETVLAADRIGTADAWYQALPPSFTLMLPGTLDSVEHMADALRALAADEPNALRAWAALLRAWTQTWRGHTQRAFESLTQAEDDARWDGGHGPVLSEVCRLRALLLAQRGLAPAAWRAVERSLTLLPPAALPDQARASAAALAFERRLRVAVLLGDDAGVRQALARLPPAGVQQGPDPLRLHLGIADGVLAALRGDWREAADRWGALLPEMHRLEGQGQAGELRLRLAAAWMRVGERHAAAQVLRPLLRAPGAATECGPALLAGLATVQTLRDASWQDELDAGELQLLQLWYEQVRGDAATAALVGEAGLVDGVAPISAREAEVLERLARGEANKLIARRLGLSPHTVKRHVANILDKLDLRSRGQAAAWFHQQRRADGG